MSLNAFFQFPNNESYNKSIVFKSIVSPEYEKDFEYLIKFLKFRKIKDEKKKEELLEKEKKFINDIMYPHENKKDHFKAWIEFIDWIGKTFKPDDLRFFFIIENFVKCLRFFKDSYQEEELIKRLIIYADLCRDFQEIFKQLTNIPNLNKNHLLYQGLALIYEKIHDFKNADSAFLKGFNLKVIDVEYLKKNYKLFADRMETRIQRELENSKIDENVIIDHLNDEMKKKTHDIQNLSEIPIGQKRRYENFLQSSILLTNSGQNSTNFTKNLKYTIKSNISPYEPNLNSINQNYSSFQSKILKTEFINNTLKDPDNPINQYSYYGNLPIYIDESNRDSAISKATKLVEFYGIIVKFLLENDQEFKLKNEKYDHNIKEENNLKPYSIFRSDRNILDLVDKKSLSLDCFFKDNIEKDIKYSIEKQEKEKKEKYEKEKKKEKEKDNEKENEKNENILNKNQNFIENNYRKNIENKTEKENKKIETKNPNENAKEKNKPKLRSIDEVMVNLVTNMEKKMNQVKLDKKEADIGKTNNDEKNKNKYTVEINEVTQLNETKKNEPKIFVEIEKVEKEKKIKKINFISEDMIFSDRYGKIPSIEFYLINSFNEKLIQLQNEKLQTNDKNNEKNQSLKSPNLKNFRYDSDGDVILSSDDEENVIFIPWKI